MSKLQLSIAIGDYDRNRHCKAACKPEAIIVDDQNRPDTRSRSSIAFPSNEGAFE